MRSSIMQQTMRTSTPRARRLLLLPAHTTVSRTFVSAISASTLPRWNTRSDHLLRRQRDCSSSLPQQHQQQQLRWLSNLNGKKDESSPQGEEEQQPAGTASVTLVGVDDDDDANLEQMGEPNESPHPPESLVGDSKQYTVKIIVHMPDMGEGDNNKIEQWYKQPGDVIKRNDVLCDITTPDFTFGMVTEDEEDAIMGEIHVPAGETADDSAPICTIWHPEPEPSSKKE